MEENLAIFDFNLSDSDMQIIHGLNTNSRLIEHLVEPLRDHKYFPFKIDF